MEQIRQCSDRRHDAERQPARQALADMGKCAGTVDLDQSTGRHRHDGGRVIGNVPVEFVCRGVAEHGIEVVAQHFCSEILLMGQPAQTGNGFEREAMLQPFEQGYVILPINISRMTS
ncbi:hypothetical protein R69746_08479 [Paraburkholderia aspalathi]|nr:hypothetical protein R69746_08479 [Paraburkholderia aspalathi]